MPPPPGMDKGFVLKVFAADTTTKVFINVCGHHSVGMPLTRSMDPIPDAQYLDVHGLDNLMIPISVGDPHHCKRTSAEDEGKMIIVDVVIHSEIVKRVVPSHRLYEELLSKTTALALEWVTKETGVQLSQRTAKVLQNVSYKDVPTRQSATDSLNDFDKMDPRQKREMENNVRQRANELYQQLLKETTTTGQNARAPNAMAVPTYESEAKVKLPQELNLGAAASQAAASASAAPTSSNPPKRSMIVEMPAQGPMMKKGFLNSSNARLYGEEGSKEGILPDGAGDPLGYLPKGIRERCKVIDTRPEAQQQQRNQAQTAKVLPHTVGTADEVGGAEFLQQLAAMDKILTNGDPAALQTLSQSIDREVESARKTADSPSQLTSQASKQDTTLIGSGASIKTANQPNSLTTWESTISSHEADTPDGKSLITIRLTAPPNVLSMKDIDLTLEPTTVEVNGFVVHTPVAVDVDTVKAKFVKSSRVLVITCNAA